MPARRPYQFTIARLLMLSTAVALCLATAGWLTSTLVGQAVAGIYFTLLAAWAVMRWPVVRANLREVRQRRQRVLDERAAILADARRRRPEVADDAPDASERQ